MRHHGKRSFEGRGDVAPEVRFWSKVEKRSADECWPWLGRIDLEGYGRIKIGGKATRAHRLSWNIANGRAAPSGMCVCHRCDNPPCVNPAHLWLGTAGDNIADMHRKGRASPACRTTRREWTHCIHGHEFTPENTSIKKNGTRSCKACAKARKAARRITQSNKGV